VKGITQMKRLFDYNPSTGATETFEYNHETGGFSIETVEDVEPALEFARGMRNDPEITKQGIKNSWWHIAHLPDTIILKMRQEDGVDVYNPNHAEAVGRLLNDKYSKFKLTDGKHKIKS